jgi:hypothetical protein
VSTAEKLERPHGLGYVQMVRALYLVGRGEWSEAQASAEKCQEICDEVGDPVSWGNAQIIRFWLRYYRGQTELAESVAAALLSRARRTGNRQQETWALRALALLRLRHGMPEAALPQLENALLQVRKQDVNEYMPTLAALALCHLYQGDAEHASHLADEALRLAMLLERPTGHAILPGLLALAEVTLMTAGSAVTGDQRFGAALERLSAYARVFPIGVPAHLTWSALEAERRGQLARAEKLLARSEAAATALQMPPVAQPARIVP